MLSHIHIGGTDNALDGGEVHAQRLHLRYIGVSAGVRRQLTHSFDFLESFPKFIPEIGGIARGILLALLPDEFRIHFTKLPCAPAQIGRHRDTVDIRGIGFLVDYRKAIWIGQWSCSMLRRAV